VGGYRKNVPLPMRLAYVGLGSGHWPGSSGNVPLGFLRSKARVLCSLLRMTILAETAIQVLIPEIIRREGCA
jgi:hypothetical protein